MADGTNAPITIFVHVHYPDIWQDMSVRLADRLREPFHLVLTTAGPPETLVLPRSDAMLSARILPVENRGRDVLPFLRALAETPEFEIGLKLHTKKSPQREDGTLWRNALLDSLLPPEDGGRAIVGRLRADRRIGLVAPAGFCLSVRPWILTNRPGMQRVMTTLGAELSDALLEDAFFAAGSMFWFRRSALTALSDPAVTALFEPEEAQLDGTIAHAMERLFPVEAARQGYLSLAEPALGESSPGMSTPRLLNRIRRHADIPSRFFPAPYVAALPLSASLPPSGTLAGIYRTLVPVAVRRALRQLLRR